MKLERKLLKQNEQSQLPTPPKLSALSVDRIWKIVKDTEIGKYFPINMPETKPPPREFLWQVISSVNKSLWEFLMSECRKELEAYEEQKAMSIENQTCEVHPKFNNMLKTIDQTELDFIVSGKKYKRVPTLQGINKKPTEKKSSPGKRGIRQHVNLN